VGTVEFHDSHYVFNMEKPIPGLARRLQESVKKHCGKKFPIMCGNERAGADDDQPAGAEAGEGKKAGAGAAAGAAAGGAAAAAGAADAGANLNAPFSISASVGQGGKNKSEDVQAVQGALNKKNKAGLNVDGKCGPKTIAAIKAFQQAMGKFKPDGLIEPGRATARALAGSAPMGPPPAPPKPVVPPKLPVGTLNKAADTWRSQISNCRQNCVELEKTIMADCKHEHPTLVKDIQDNFKKVHGLFDKFGNELEQTIDKANSAKDAATRNAHLQQCKTILTNHMKYVKSEPLFAHIDRNPWVPTNCTQMLTDCFKHVAQAIGVPK
jgi:peptidoglycan hydrolase-like protein with peptidoglycan-binding domain